MYNYYQLRAGFMHNFGNSMLILVNISQDHVRSHKSQARKKSDLKKNLVTDCSGLLSG